MKMKACLALLALVAMATSASAAKLVVIAVNSGTGLVANAFPPVAAGSKGFLIGIDNTADILAPLSFQDLTFSGPGLVQRLAPNAFAAEAIPSPNVNLRNEALSANIPDPVAGSTFGANDSWWWNQVQDGLTLAAVSTGLQGGLPGGPMTYTASFNTIGNVPAGVWRTVYIVATGDAALSGILASGQLGFDLATGAHLPNNSVPSVARLDFASGTIVPIPEPSTLVLAALGLVGLGVGAWKRRK